MGDAPLATFLLVHCGFAGGWTWNEVADLLRSKGHRVHAPTLTGLGERAHLASPGVDLSTHIQDLHGVAACEEVTEPFVVASSSGAMAATGFALATESPVRRIVYIDTLVPEVGQSWMDLLGPSVSSPLMEAAKRFGDGWRVPRSDVQPPRWVPQPLASVTQPLPPGRRAPTDLAVSYVFCSAKPAGWFFGLDTVIAEQAARARAAGWDYHELASDHLPMLSAPGPLGQLIDDIAQRAGG
jgi:pimeloyl-ACP methyl ester carboxylesterase